MGATDMEIAAMYRDQAFGTQSEKRVDGRCCGPECCVICLVYALYPDIQS